MCLKVINLSKSFDGKVIYDNFSYKFNDKGLYIIEGESGIGKTTLLRMICGLDKDFSGEILGGGIAKTSYVFQEHRLFPNLNLLENVTVVFKKTTLELTEQAKAVLLRLNFTEEDMKLYPGELSGGMKQRVSIARGLMKSSPILLLDEPFKEIDPLLVNKLIDIVKEESRNRLVLLVTHTNVSDNFPDAIRIKI